MPLPIEKREYGPDSTPQEVEALESHIYMYCDNVVYWKEVPVMSCWQVELFAAKINQLVLGLDNFSILIDLTDSKPPNARIRESLRNMLVPLRECGLQKVAAFTGKNFLINVAAKFVLGGSGLDFSVHTTQAQAEATIVGSS